MDAVAARPMVAMTVRPMVAMTARPIVAEEGTGRLRSDVASRGRRRAMDIRVAVAVPALAEDAPRSGLARRGALSCGDRRLPPGRLRARHLVAMAALPMEAEEGIGRLRKDV